MGLKIPLVEDDYKLYACNIQHATKYPSDLSKYQSLFFHFSYIEKRQSKAKEGREKKKEVREMYLKYRLVICG